MKQVIVTVEEDGSIKVEAEGFHGEGCAQATKAIEQALGSAGKRNYKQEFYVRKELKKALQ